MGRRVVMLAEFRGLFSVPGAERFAGACGRHGTKGRRLLQPPSRPVLKHGPRSLTHARAAGPCETRRRSEGEAPSAGEQGVILRKKAQRRPISVVPTTRSRKSASVRTRKMVNYAWAGRSQRKLWWRAAAILTCKSIVRPGHRGERLIEPSSSWFLPKFPSG